MKFHLNFPLVAEGLPFRVEASELQPIEFMHLLAQAGEVFLATVVA
jgi:hypothetical protein